MNQSPVMPILLEKILEAAKANPITSVYWGQKELPKLESCIYGVRRYRPFNRRVQITTT